MNTFARMRAIIDSGHLADMTGMEAKALFVFCVCADNASGEAWPSMEKIAKDIGTANVGRARKAIQSLVGRGVLELVSSGGGYGRSACRKLADFPPPINRDGKRPRKSDLQGRKSSPFPEKTTGTVCDTYRDGLRQTTGTETVPRTTKELPRTTHSQKKGKAGPAMDEAIARVWEAYPNKAGKPKGTKAIAMAIERISKRPDAPTDVVGWLVAKVEAYAKAVEGKAKKYIKYPEGWFNDDRFDDMGAGDDAGGDDAMTGLGTDGWKRAELTPEDIELIQRPFEPHEVMP